MGFQEAIKTAYNKYGDFRGTATKSEFWWFALYIFIADILIYSLDSIIFGADGLGYGPLSSLFTIAHIIPNLSLGARRLHDIRRSGWWQLISLTIIGNIFLIYWWIQPSLKNTQFNNSSSNQEFEPLSDMKKDDINISNSDNNKQSQGKTKFR